jgi:S-formylglutathione hydrolase FrmB
MNFPKPLLFLSSLFITHSLLFAAKTDTVTVYSNSMKKNIKACVVTPDSYTKEAKPYPVLYLLHGHGDNYAGYVKNYPHIGEYCDNNNIIIVCPDGNVSSWYLDSPVDPAWKYETHVAVEVVSFIDKNYNTIKSNKGRAITGLSMGGFGSLYLALRHKEVFGAAGSMSGGVDFRPFPANWGLPEKLGEMAEHPENWEKNIILNQLYHADKNGPLIIFDCGTGDFFYNVNRELHERMLYLNIKHDYIERPGVHNEDYWRNALDYQVLFFTKFFSKGR